MSGDDEEREGFASPPCQLHEVDPAWSGLPPADVARWRRGERARLIDERMRMGVEERRVLGVRMIDHLDALLGDVAGLTIAGWWPIKGEPNLRPWLTGLAARGATAALPVVVERAQPLVFRHWASGVAMERGFWNIPVPVAGPELVPDIVLAPIVGFDDAGYRLGHGGGYFDRTLAARVPRPRAIGVGMSSARLATIHPQWHDIPMQAIVTEEGVRAGTAG